MMKRDGAVCAAGLIFLSGALLGPSGARAEVLQLERVLHTGSTRFWTTGDDYDIDGTKDLIVSATVAGSKQMQVVSGASGSVLQSYQWSGNQDYWAHATTVGDMDGDGFREIVLRSNTSVRAIKSSAGSGDVDALDHVFAFDGLPYGHFLGSSGRSVVIPSGDESKLLFVDPATGAIQARVVHNAPFGYRVSSLGNSVVNLGDLNGDGVDDFASSGAAVSNWPEPSGRVFVLDGAIATQGTDYESLMSLPQGSVLAELSGVQDIGYGNLNGGGNTTANLGDPNPGNGIKEFLLVSGGPRGEYGRGGIAAHVLSEDLSGGFSTTRTAAYVPTAGEAYGGEVISIGDVTGDGVGDVAIFAGGHDDTSSGKLLGRIDIVSGAGLLDGFDPLEDVLQSIEGLPDAFFYNSMHSLGDYDGDGRLELGVSVLYNGRDGVYTDAQHIYEIIPVPEPISIMTLSIGSMLAARRRRVA